MAFPSERIIFMTLIFCVDTPLSIVLRSAGAATLLTPPARCLAFALSQGRGASTAVSLRRRHDDEIILLCPVACRKFSRI